MSRRDRDLINPDQQPGWRREADQEDSYRSRLPQIEVVTREEPEQPSPRRRPKSSMLLWFLATFALVAIPASVWNYTRPPVYRASAMVLTIVPEDRSGYGDAAANLQHVAIQRSILLGRQLLQDTVARLRGDLATMMRAVPGWKPAAAARQGASSADTGSTAVAGLIADTVLIAEDAPRRPRETVSADARSATAEPAAEADAPPSAADLTPDDLLKMLAVEPVAETNLVELSARGGDPVLLARIVNEWLAAYEVLRDREIEAQVGDRLDKLSDRQRQLEERIQAKRQELDRFRERFDIVSLGRDSNEAMERLNALQNQLSEAEAATAAARAERERIEKAMANGRSVVSDRVADRLSRLGQQAQEARARVLQLRERYTDYFIEKDLNKRRIIEQLERIEQQMAEVERQGSREALENASDAVGAARARVAELRQALTAQKARASRFSSGFAAFESLQEDLAGLEEMQREVESQRVSLETTVYADYPQIEIIEPAFAPRDPIHPDYARDLMLTLIAATALGLLTVLTLAWLDISASRSRASTPVTGVRIWGSESQGDEGAATDQQRLQQEARRALGARAASAAEQPALIAKSQSAPRQLTAGDVEALWELADTDERQLIGLLLSGVQPNEARSLTRDNFDLAAGELRLSDIEANARTLKLPPRLLAVLNDIDALPAWEDRSSQRFDDLIHRLSLLAADAGISEPDHVDASTLHDTYMIYLVRQGARLTRLSQVTGPMSGAETLRFAPFSPPGASRPFDEIDLTYPALA